MKKIIFVLLFSIIASVSHARVFQSVASFPTEQEAKAWIKENTYLGCLEVIETRKGEPLKVIYLVRQCE